MPTDEGRLWARTRWARQIVFSYLPKVSKVCRKRGSSFGGSSTGLFGSLMIVHAQQHKLCSNCRRAARVASFCSIISQHTGTLAPPSERVLSRSFEILQLHHVRLKLQFRYDAPQFVAMILQLDAHPLEHVVRYAAQRAASNLVLEKQLSVLLIKMLTMTLQPLDYVGVGPLRQMLWSPVLIHRHRRGCRWTHVALLLRVAAASNAD